MSRGLLFVITAPSGCGKGTLRRALLADNNEIRFCPSVTTRAPRPGEVDGVDYFFVSREEFSRMKDSGELSEWAEVYGNFYGTPRRDIEETLASGVDVILEKDVQGARTLRGVYPDGVFVFVLPPSVEELRRRISGRGTESEKDMEVRLRSAEGEMSDLSPFDYVIINADIGRAQARLSAIVAGERARRAT
jgi:guanylate kinase